MMVFSCVSLCNDKSMHVTSDYFNQAISVSRPFSIRIQLKDTHAQSQDAGHIAGFIGVTMAVPEVETGT